MTRSSPSLPPSSPKAKRTLPAEDAARFREEDDVGVDRVMADGLHAAPSGPSPQLVEETRREIRAIVQDVAELSQSDVEPAEFYRQFLERVVSALAAIGGAIWLRDEQGKIELARHLNIAATGLAADKEHQLRHAKLLEEVMETGKPALAGPASGAGDEADAGNPTELLLVIGLLIIDQKVRGVVEIFQRPGAGPNTQRGYLRFVAQMCDLASGYVQARELKTLTSQQSQWQKLEQFARAVHRSLDVRDTAYTIANDGRGLIGCDRVSVGIVRGGQCEIASVSGIDTLDPRAATVTRLADLAGVVAAANEPLWHSGGTEDLPPQIEGVLQAYLDVAHARAIGLVPLREESPDAANDSAAAPTPGRIVGMLVVEHLQSGDLAAGWEGRTLTVAGHAGPALANATEHSSVFLLPLWKTIGQLAVLFDADGLPRTITVLSILGAIIAALIIVPYDFALHGEGKLQPKIQRDVYAPQDGEVVEVGVDHGSQITASTAVAKLRNTELEVQLTNLIGQRNAMAEQIRSLQRAIIEGGRRVDPEEQNRISGQLAQIKKNDESLERQVRLLREKEKQLVIASPIDGQVVTWQVRDLLVHRPVTKGQVLMTVVDPSGEWQLEIDMPESRMGHITAAARGSKEPLAVTFVLATHPGEEFSAQVVEIHQLADSTGTEGSTVRIKASLDKTKLPELRPGAAVTTKVHCGLRPLGYVLFHDVIAFVQKKVLFWL